MPSELDRRFDEKLAELTGPDGRLVIGRDTRGQAIVEQFSGNAARAVSRLLRSPRRKRGDRRR